MAPATPAVTLARAIAYLRVGTGEEPTVADCLQTAADRLAGVTFRVEPPESIMVTATLELTAEYFNRSKSRLGVMQIAGADNNPIRMRLDPWKSVEAILAPYIGLVIS